MKLSVATALYAVLAACSEAAPPEGPPPDYGCLEPKHILLFNEDELASACVAADGMTCDRPGLAFPAGRETRLKLRVFDDDGRLCDPAQTTVGFVDSDDFAAAGDGNDFLVVPMRDAFDNGLLEPSAVMVVSHGALSARWQAMSAVDLAGSWEIAVDGLTVGDFEAAQSGRFIRWSLCAPEDTRPECSAGLVNADRVRLQSPIGSLTLDGVVAPTRDRIEGTWSSGLPKGGTWTAAKLPDE